MDWENLAYIVASILFILGIKMLGSAETARKGNLVSSAGMLIAVVAVIAGMLAAGKISWPLILGGLALGSAIGAVAAVRVPMTGMPEMVALFNGFGGLASLLVGWAETISRGAVPLPPSTGIAVVAAILIGGLTFTGSMVAYLKLAGIMKGAARVFPGQKLVNGSVFAALLACGLAWLALGDPILLWAVILLSLLLGYLGTLPIGGGDMPVVIAFLNSCSGLAGAAAGFVILNNVLIVAGCLVGTSGLILTAIMCKAMNRTFANVLFGGFGADGAKHGQQVEGEMKPLSVEDAYYVLEAAKHIMFVPGYGMAVAQAQHAVEELAEILEENGAEVSFAIHPVAGRMPGHMNVLLAEADVPYEKLKEMDDVNPLMSSVDVAVVVGANDVVNPAAIEDQSSPIYGMPIINVHQARSVFVLKRGKGAGFSGIENNLFFRENTRMIYGDAKHTLTALVTQFKR